MHRCCSRGLARLGLPVLTVKVESAGGLPPGGFRRPYAHSLVFCGCEYPSSRSVINPMGVLTVGLRGFCLTLTPEHACRFPDAVSVAEPRAGVGGEVDSLTLVITSKPLA